MKENEMMEKMIKQAEDDARKNLSRDSGHLSLLNDLKSLLNEALECEFHDILNKKYATPKIELHKKLLQIDKDLQDGKYDN